MRVEEVDYRTPGEVACGLEKVGGTAGHRPSLAASAQAACLTRSLVLVAKSLTSSNLSPAAFDRLTADLDEVARRLHGLRSNVDGA